MKKNNISFEFKEVYTRLEKVSSTLIGMMENVDENGKRISYDPDIMAWVNKSLACLIDECRDCINILCSDLNNYSEFSFWSGENSDLMREESEGIFSTIQKLLDFWMEVYYEYSISGSSGNPPIISGLAAWGVMLGEECPSLIHTIDKTIYDFQYLENQVNLAEMRCVYAPPEMMSSTRVLNNDGSIGNEYPLNHAVPRDDEENDQFDLNDLLL